MLFLICNKLSTLHDGVIIVNLFVEKEKEIIAMKAERDVELLRMKKAEKEQCMREVAEKLLASEQYMHESARRSLEEERGLRNDLMNILKNIKVNNDMTN